MPKRKQLYCFDVTYHLQYYPVRTDYDLTFKKKKPAVQSEVKAVNSDKAEKPSLLETGAVLVIIIAAGVFALDEWHGNTKRIEKHKLRKGDPEGKGAWCTSLV